MTGNAPGHQTIALQGRHYEGGITRAALRGETTGVRCGDRDLAGHFPGAKIGGADDFQIFYVGGVIEDKMGDSRPLVHTMAGR
jgi:hypothetical protein